MRPHTGSGTCGHYLNYSTPETWRQPVSMFGVTLFCALLGIGPIKETLDTHTIARSAGTQMVLVCSGGRRADQRTMHCPACQLPGGAICLTGPDASPIFAHVLPLTGSDFRTYAQREKVVHFPAARFKRPRGLGRTGCALPPVRGVRPITIAAADRFCSQVSNYS
jgi:hypothetical protein